MTDKEHETVQAMQAQEQAQHTVEEAQQVAMDDHAEVAQVKESRKKAEDNKNRALNSLLLKDYIRGRGGGPGCLGEPQNASFQNYVN